MNRLWISIIFLSVVIAAGCSDNKSTESDTRTVPHEGNWGIYTLDLASDDVSLLYSTDDEITNIDLNGAGTIMALTIKSQSGVEIDNSSEIYLLDIAGVSLTQLTDNDYFDTYPSFSPDGSKIAFLSLRGATLDLYIMDADGTDQEFLYDSGGHDADVDWGSNDMIVFTRDYQIWSISPEGTNLQQETDPDNAGVWGSANLPIGDYDPRISPDGTKIVFERLLDVSFPHGGYDIFVASLSGSGLTRLTYNSDDGYAQGLPVWSHGGDKLVYLLSAIGTEGKYDLCMMNADGTDNKIITPDYFPPLFLCHNAVFSLDDTKVYFIGQWWQQ